jgi:hypothetical protein
MPRNQTEMAEYGTWHAMKTRCSNPNRSDWKNYGGRGITICERWRNSFAAFLRGHGGEAVTTAHHRTYRQ